MFVYSLQKLHGVTFETVVQIEKYIATTLSSAARSLNPIKIA